MLRATDKKILLGRSLAGVLNRPLVYDSEVLADSPVLYLTMQELSGTSLPNLGSLGGNASTNGTVTLGRPISPGLGVGIDLGGSSTDFISYADDPALDITGDVTYEVWARITDFTRYNCLMTKGATTVGVNGGYEVRVEQTTRDITIQKSLFSIVITAQSAWPNNSNWHHFAFTRSGNNYLFYMDGVVIYGNDNSTSYDASIHPFCFGVEVSGAGGTKSQPLAGSVSHGAVYNTALSAARIATHYLAGVQSFSRIP